MAKTDHPVCSKTRWQGREAYTLSNGLLQMVNLTGGGHIAELRFADGSGFPTLNPLWIPNWKGMEPFQYRAKLHAKRYGPMLEGKLLSGIAGHKICLDYFGPPSEEEAAQGLSTHGEAPSLKWRKSSARLRADQLSLTLSVRLPGPVCNSAEKLRCGRESRWSTSRRPSPTNANSITSFTGPSMPPSLLLLSRPRMAAFSCLPPKGLQAPLVMAGKRCSNRGRSSNGPSLQPAQEAKLTFPTA